MGIATLKKKKSRDKRNSEKHLSTKAAGKTTTQVTPTPLRLPPTLNERESMASSASDITETSQEFASGKNITSDQKAKKLVSSRASPDETATIDQINTTNSNLGPSNEISKSAEDRLASTTVSAAEMSSDEEIDYYDLSEKTPEEKEQLRERLKKLIENTEAILDITSSTKSRTNGGVSTITTIVPSVTEESPLTEQTRVIPKETTTVKVEGTTVQETTAKTAISTTTSTVTTTTVSSTTTTEAQGDDDYYYYEYDPSFWEEKEAEQEAEYKQILQDVQESRKNEAATLGVSGDGVGGGNLGQITLEDIRFVGGDPINSNDLFIKDEPAWDARQNFIEGSLQKTWMFIPFMFCGLVIGLVAWLLINAVYKGVYRVRKRSSASSSVVGSGGRKGSSDVAGGGRGASADVEQPAVELKLTNILQNQNKSSTVSLGGKKFNVTAPTTPSGGAVPYYNSCYTAAPEETEGEGSGSSSFDLEDGRSSSWRSSSLPRSLVGGGQPPSRGGATNSSRSASGSPFVVPVAAADSTKAGKAESPDHEEIQVVAVVTESNEYHSAIEFEDLKSSQAEGSSPNRASSSKNSPRSSKMQ